MAKLFAGTPKSTLAEWRDVGILPEPISISLGRRGSASYYPAGTDALFARLREPGRAARDRDPLIWDLWLDPADYPVNMRRWISRRVDKFLAVLSDPGAAEYVSALKSPEKTRALINDLPRRHPARVILGNIKDGSALVALCSWALDVADDDRVLGVSLYDAQSPVLAALLKVFGLPTNFSPAPDKKINPEMLSLAYLGELVKKVKEDTAAAGDEELSQVRSDCRAIEALAKVAEWVDWNAVSRALDTNAAFLNLTSTEPPSYRSSRAERHTHRKNQLQPKVIRTLLAAWNSVEIKALLVPALIYIRRSSGHAKSVSEIIALCHLALTQFPRGSKLVAEFD